MNVSVRSYLTSGLVAATAGAIVVTPIEAQAPAEALAQPVALTAQVQPLELPAQIPALIAEQVAFNAGVAVDFVVTGAGLIGQQVQVAQRLADDIGNGTPVPVALSRAVMGFINIEVVAGHELVGFARQLVDFQIQFLGNITSQLPPPIAKPAGQQLAVSADAVDAVSDAANDIIDRLAQLTPNLPASHSAPKTSGQPNNIVALRRDNTKSTGVQRNSTNPAISSVGEDVRQVSNTLRDSVRRSFSANADKTAEESNAASDHQQRHWRDRQQDNSGNGNAEHAKATD